MATILATFDIRPPKDATGDYMPLTDVKYSGGMVRYGAHTRQTYVL